MITADVRGVTAINNLWYYLLVGGDSLCVYA